MWAIWAMDVFRKKSVGNLQQKSPTALKTAQYNSARVSFFSFHHPDNIKSRFDKMLPISGEGSTSGKVALITGITGQVRVDPKVANI
jgi:hypothetical protein